MQALRLCSRVSRARRIAGVVTRGLSSIPPSNPSSAVYPWFLDPTEETSQETSTRPSEALSRNAGPSTFIQHPPIPTEIPSTSAIAHLYNLLKTSPHLEPGTLLIREPVPSSVGPPLPLTAPKGKRKRGRTYFGEGIVHREFDGGGIWSWIILAQVKEGTEKRGAIESVVRLVRKALLSANPPITVPHGSKRKFSDGWAMLDAGEFAVHILSREARETFFPERREW